MREGKRDSGTHRLGVDVSTLLDQLVAQSFHLGLDCIHQHSLFLLSPKDCQIVHLYVPEQGKKGEQGHLRAVEVPNRGQKPPPKSRQNAMRS